MNDASRFWPELTLRLAEFLRALFVPRTFGALKVRLLSLVILGLVLDIGIKFQLAAGALRQWPQFSFELAGPDTTVIVAALVTAVFFVAADLVLHLRRITVDHDLMKLATDPQTDPELRKAIIKAVTLREENREQVRAV
jgi:hypothetical protein